MNHFKTILNHEFQNQLKSFKFLLVLVITLLVTLFCVFIQVKDFAERKEQYNQQIERKNKIINEARVFSEFAVPIVIKPNPLSIFAKGYDEKLGNEIMISWKNLPEFKRFDYMQMKSKETVGFSEKNSFLNIFTEFDVTSIIIIILSILSIFVVADSISGERENQTLKLIYTNPLKRFEFFTAKFLGNLIILTIPLIVIFVSATLMIVLQPFIQIEENFYLRVFLLFLGCILFISLFTLIALSISAATSSSSKSLIYGLLVWIILVFVYPNSIQFIVEKSVPAPSLLKIENKVEEFKDNFRKDKMKFLKNSPVNSYTFFIGGMLPRIIGVTSKAGFNYHRKEIKKFFPEIQNFQNETMASIKKYRNKLKDRQKIIDRFLKIMPNHLIEKTGKILANTDRFARDVYIRQNAKRFRKQVLEYMRSKDGFGYKFFTQMKPENMRKDYLDYPKSYFRKYSRGNYPKLNLKDVPQFSYKKLFRFPVEILYMVVINVILFIFGSFLFMRSNLL